MNIMEEQQPNKKPPVFLEVKIHSVHVDTRSTIWADYKKKELISPFTVSYVKSKEPTKRYTLTVKAGYVFDGASIPRAAWPITGHPWSRFLPAALVHDVIYDTQIMTRAEADQLFKELMLWVNVPKWKASLMYKTVHLAAQHLWDNRTKDMLYDNSKHIALTRYTS